MRNLVFLAVLLLVFFKFGCTERSTKDQASEKENPTVPLPQPLPPLPPEGETILSDYGLGPVKKDTPFNKDSLEILLEGFKISGATRESGRGTYDILVGYKGDTKVFEFFPDSRGEKIRSIRLFTGDFDGPDGIHVGMTYRAAKGETMNCFPGMESESGKLLCFKGGNTRVQYIFSHDYNGPDDKLPPPDILAATGKVEQIIWFAGKN